MPSLNPDAFLEKPRSVNSIEETETLALLFLKAFPRGLTVGLAGDLGAGKTTFVRACVEAICRRQNLKFPRVISPSFVIHQSYAHLNPPVEHFDLYRMGDATAQSLVELGYYDAVERCRSQHGFVFVEWPQQAQSDPAALHLDAGLSIELDGESRKFQLVSTLKV